MASIEPQGDGCSENVAEDYTMIPILLCAHIYNYVIKCNLLSLISSIFCIVMASKRTSSELEDEGTKHPRKLRRLSGFNIWHREFLKSEGN